MRNLILALSAVSLAIPVSMTVPTGNAEARKHYSGRTYRHHRVCRHSSGTTGLVAGGVGGALVGQSVFGHGLLGTAAGGVGGAFAGRAIDRTITAKKRCR
jgi:uncharacterized protein YcfJ